MITTFRFAGDDLRVLVDHVRDAPALVDDLAPSVAVEVLAAQLTAADVPSCAICVGRVLEDLGQLLALLDEFLQPKKVSVDAEPVACVQGVLCMCGDCGAEELLAFGGPDFGIRHGVAESDGLVRDGARCLGAALRVLAYGSGFISWAVLAVHLVVGKLDDHLHVGVGAAFELLDQAFAIALISLYPKLVCCNGLVELLLGGVEVLDNFGVGFEADDGGFRETGSHRRVVKVELVVDDICVDCVRQSVGRGAVHHGVLAHEACCAVVVDNKL